MTDVGKKRVREETPEHDDVLDLLNRQAKTVFLSVEPPSCKNLLDINDRGEEHFLPKQTLYEKSASIFQQIRVPSQTPTRGIEGATELISFAEKYLENLIAVVNPHQIFPATVQPAKRSLKTSNLLVHHSLCQKSTSIKKSIGNLESRLQEMRERTKLFRSAHQDLQELGKRWEIRLSSLQENPTAHSLSIFLNHKPHQTHFLSSSSSEIARPDLSAPEPTDRVQILVSNAKSTLGIDKSSILNSQKRIVMRFIKTAEDGFVSDLFSLERKTFVFRSLFQVPLRPPSHWSPKLKNLHLFLQNKQLDSVSHLLFERMIEEAKTSKKKKNVSYFDKSIRIALESSEIELSLADQTDFPDTPPNLLTKEDYVAQAMFLRLFSMLLNRESFEIDNTSQKVPKGWTHGKIKPLPTQNKSPFLLFPASNPETPPSILQDFGAIVSHCQYFNRALSQIERMMRSLSPDFSGDVQWTNFTPSLSSINIPTTTSTLKIFVEENKLILNNKSYAVHYECWCIFRAYLAKIHTTQILSVLNLPQTNVFMNVVRIAFNKSELDLAVSITSQNQWEYRLIWREDKKDSSTEKKIKWEDVPGHDLKSKLNFLHLLWRTSDPVPFLNLISH